MNTILNKIFRRRSNWPIHPVPSYSASKRSRCWEFRGFKRLAHAVSEAAQQRVGQMSPAPNSRQTKTFRPTLFRRQIYYFQIYSCQSQMACSSLCRTFQQNMGKKYNPKVSDLVIIIIFSYKKILSRPFDNGRLADLYAGILLIKLTKVYGANSFKDLFMISKRDLQTKINFDWLETWKSIAKILIL